MISNRTQHEEPLEVQAVFFACFSHTHMVGVLLLETELVHVSFAG